VCAGVGVIASLLNAYNVFKGPGAAGETVLTLTLTLTLTLAPSSLLELRSRSSTLISRCGTGRASAAARRGR